MTNMESRGFQAWEAELGSRGVKVPSSRSLSYTIIVPSAWETRKRVEEDGTHRTDVQGDEDMQPCNTVLGRSEFRDRKTYLFVETAVS